jgi:hypothetical protein
MPRQLGIKVRKRGEDKEGRTKGENNFKDSDGDAVENGGPVRANCGGIWDEDEPGRWDTFERGVRGREMREMRDKPRIAKVNQRTLRERESIVLRVETFWSGE